MSIKVEITKIPAHFIWIMGLLEAITVPLVVTIPAWTNTALKNPLHGMVVGFTGVGILFYCINLMLGKLNINLMKCPIISINIFPSAFWSGLILALIFIIQSVLKSLIPFGYPLKEILLGFFSAGGAILLSGLIYRICISRLPFLAIAIRTSAGLFQVKNYSLWRFALLSGAYESIALPIILLWSFFPREQVMAAFITGILGGMVGGAFIWLMVMIANVLFFFILEEVPTTGQTQSKR